MLYALIIFLRLKFKNCKDIFIPTLSFYGVETAFFLKRKQSIEYIFNRIFFILTALEMRHPKPLGNFRIALLFLALQK